MTSIRIGVVSGAPSKKNIRKNYDYIVQMTKTQHLCSLISFGELFLISDRDALEDENIWEVLKMTLSDIQALAISTKTAIAVGHPFKFEDKYFICHSVFMPNGEIERYKKVHLGKNEQLYFEAGHEIKVFHYDGFTFGIQLCIDTHVPEMTLSQKLKGVEIILAPFNTPYSTSQRICNWKKYIPARAYEYNVVLLCHNTGGGIFAVNGYGDRLCEDDGIASMDIIEISKEKSFNKKVDYLSYRRPELY